MNVELATGFAHDFAELASSALSQADAHNAFTEATVLAVKYVPGCDWASISASSGTTSRTLAASDPIAAIADQLHHQVNQGSCWRSTHSGTTDPTSDAASGSCHSQDMEALGRRSSAHSILRFRLRSTESAFNRYTSCSLNLYAAAADAFSTDSAEIGAIFATHVSTTVALIQLKEHADNLNTALKTSRQISAAIGILMALHRVTEKQAFDLLREASQHLHIKLRDVASAVLETGAVPKQPAQ